MKRQVLTLIAILTLVVAGALFAQSYPPAQQPPSQQVDQSGQPETGPGPDVDVDTGANAEDGVLDVDVNRTTDPDTAAQGNDTDTTTGVDADTETLPDTGSELPLLGLVGLLALGAAVVVRSIR